MSRAWRRAARAVVGGVGRGPGAFAAIGSGHAAGGRRPEAVSRSVQCATSPTEENRHCVKTVVLVVAPKRPIRDSDCHIFRRVLALADKIACALPKLKCKKRERELSERLRYAWVPDCGYPYRGDTSCGLARFMVHGLQVHTLTYM